MKTSEVLHKAADLIEERGWTTGPKGWDAAVRPLCIESALAAALGLGTGRGGDAQHTPAYAALMQHIATPERYLWIWNDESDSAGQRLRTAPEVIEVLRAAAVIESAREDAAVLAEVGR